MPKANKVCHCGKQRVNLNFTNWQRHIDHCVTRKTKKLNRSIQSFFSPPIKALEMETNSSNGKLTVSLLNYFTIQTVHNYSTDD